MNYFKFVTLGLMVLQLSGCDLMAIKGQQQQAETFCQLNGHIKREGIGIGNLVVVLFHHEGGQIEQKSNWKLIDHFSLEQPASWFFLVSPGKYLLTAFADLNRNQIYEHDEPAIPVNFNEAIDCRIGVKHINRDLVIHAQDRIAGGTDRDLANLQVRSTDDQMSIALGQFLSVDEVTSLKDARFSRENAEKGLWRPFDFITEKKAGLYFLGPYSSAKTPVLFVHGINGTPLDFGELITHLDHARFQPWVFYYPSGGQLERIGNVLAQLIEKSRIRYGYQKMVVIAHSMGGLVARQTLLNLSGADGDAHVHLFISIATPWNGHQAAKVGVDYAPTPIYSWIDMAPGSRFLKELYMDGGTGGRRQLPKGIPHHLIFTFLPTESGDGTVSLASQLRSEAQEESTRLYGIQQSHDGVLIDPDARKLINRLLASVP